MADNKRTLALMAKMFPTGTDPLPTEQAPPLTPSPPPIHGRPGLLKEFERMDGTALREMKELKLIKAHFNDGDADPCYAVDAALVSTGVFFNRFEEAFDPEKDKGFKALVEDIRATNGNTVAATVRPTPDAAKPFALICGERRLRACLLLKLPFKVVIGDHDDLSAAMLHARENSNREDPSVVESALQVKSWLELLGVSSRGDGESADQAATIFGYHKRYVHKLKQISCVPKDILEGIPGVRRMSVRQGLALADAWKQDPTAVRDRFESQVANAATLLPKQAIAILTASPAPPPKVARTTSAKTFTVAWPRDKETGSKLRSRLAEIEAEFGISFSLSKTAK